MRPNAGIPRIGAINRSHPHAVGLVSCWRAMPDMERGTKWYDLAGKNNGTLTNGPRWRVDGLGVDGSDDYVVASDAGFPLGTASRTMSAWMRIASAPGADSGFLAYGTAGTNLRFFGLYVQGTTGKAGLSNWSTAGALSAGSVADGKWHHVVGMLASGVMSLYVDGVFASSVTEAANTLSTGFAYIGATRPSSGWFNGVVNDCRVYNRALSATEVKSLCTDPLGMFNRVRVPVGRYAAAPASKLLLRLASEGLFVGSHC